jgi:hypothetical protein
MRTTNLLALLFAALAISAITCAPGGSPSLSESEERGGTDPAAAPIKGPKDLPIVPKERMELLKQRIEAAINNVRQRSLLTTHGFWTIFHGILGLGPSLTLLDPETDKTVNALDYLCSGNKVRGMSFEIGKDGVDVLQGEQFVAQGHQDQFIAEMAQWDIPANRKFLVKGKEFTYMDFVRFAQARASVSAKQELSWAIVVIGQYLGTDISWTNNQGEKLRFEDLVRYEVDASVEDAACGGTHRLFGLDWVYHLHLAKGGKKTGVWKDLADKSLKYQKMGKKFQHSDGSFSTNFFREPPGHARDVERRMNTSGHILEWLALALSDAQLREGWVQDAANAVSLMILDRGGESIEGGTLYHATHGLIIYYARIWGKKWLGPNAPFYPPPPG